MQKGAGFNVEEVKAQVEAAVKKITTRSDDMGLSGRSGGRAPALDCGGGSPPFWTEWS